MAGKRRRRKLKLLTDTVRNNEESNSNSKKEKPEYHTWSDLPTELLEIIISPLPFADNIRASAVCKRWNAASVSVRVQNQPPWLMYFPKSGNFHEVYDPSERKTYLLELPELEGSRICYSKDGWLLLYRPRTHHVFFFNPFTRELIELPRFEMVHQIAGFSCPPNKSNNRCIIFTIKHISPTIVGVSTCELGATVWTTTNYQNRLPFVSSNWNKLVYSNGSFYCLSLTGWLGVFDSIARTWNVLPVTPPQCPDNFFAKNWWKGKFMAEYKGAVFVIYTCCSENPIIFKLNRRNMVWVEMTSLDGLTLFASFLSSHLMTDLPGIMRNNIYFSKVRFFGRRCISYSLDDCRYYPRKQCYDWGEQEPYENIWIEPPRDVMDLI